eukprot:CAMPEP_0177543142 /NCGR_PEP_ID=MMETSP0369-20130122/61207_1 /TAXON_ID=447022 ORGANISM="Scrippsiella hangoei-like, Strain SHHI-4" /NCGR_SAMPLE_ID=MMETSP0369 /ASSEMBLY_ACC=CAM_ASM_000364 /LENGTH=94 /DNA_ID=CAMNT_0019026909 /DNA_START=404 /DNA_END=689 /DNA_ORIENTATION=+
MAASAPVSCKHRATSSNEAKPPFATTGMPTASFIFAMALKLQVPMTPLFDIVSSHAPSTGHNQLLQAVGTDEWCAASGPQPAQTQASRATGSYK